ncbi:MAG: hypothetical protein KGZ50_10535 [Peptococcaceae bacterium]|nr:hypothetical protein [Peptococcaceae bacterium]
MSDDIARALHQHNIASRLNTESLHNGLARIDALLRDPAPGLFRSPEFLLTAKAQIEAALKATYNTAKLGVLVPVGMWGLTTGLGFPDLDINLLGIGRHRFFLFHSALGLVILRKFYLNWLDSQEHPEAWSNRVRQKISEAILGSFAIGVGAHLLTDVFQPKAVIFPIFGSLVNGTLVDDNIWLLGNSLWAFKIGHDIFSLVLSDELASAKACVNRTFGQKLVLPAEYQEVLVCS